MRGYGPVDRNVGLHMDGWIALGLLIVIGVPVTLIVLIVGQSRLRHRVSELEGQITRLASAPAMSAPERVQRVDPSPDIAPDAPVPLAPPIVAPPAAAPAIAATVADVAPRLGGPWSGNRVLPAEGVTPPVRSAGDQNQPIVLRADRFAALGIWLRDNWVLAVAAVSLALAGVFLVQYGAERGLLPPPLRVLAAIAFGAALIAGGEWLRRRMGDTAGPTAYLPSTFSGAGLVSMFAGVLAARSMYGLIGPEVALFGLVAVALVALVLGWFYGPLLAAVGVIGATMAPFLVGGGSADLTWFYGYFLLVAALGLGIDTVRRWAWVSVLTLVLVTLGSGLLYLEGGQTGVFGAWFVALAAMTVIIPGRSLVPRHTGHTVVGALRLQALKPVGRVEWPAFPVRLVAGVVLAAVGVLTLTPATSAGESLMLLILLAGVTVALALWAARAPALADLAALAAAGFCVRLILEAVRYDPLARDFADAAIALRVPESAAPLTVTVILGLAVAMAGAAALRSLWGRDHPIYWAALAVGIPPVTMAVLEAFWAPADVIGAYPWALHAMALAAGMVGLALAFAAKDGAGNPRRVAYATLAALILIPFALFAILTKAALTLALAGLVVVAAALDRRFRLPELAWFVQAGCVVLGYRLVIDPGLIWAYDAPLGDVVLSFGAALGGMAGAIWLLRGLTRQAARVVLESALVGTAALFADVLLFRWLDSAFPDGAGGHWSVTLIALPWLVMALVQLHRAGLGGALRRVRIGLAVVAGGIAALGLGLAATVLNPLIASDPVGGPWVFDTLFVAYGLPAIALLAARRWIKALPRVVQTMFLWAGLGFAALYAGLEIRRWWQGDVLSFPGVAQGELYAYTLALMITGAVLLYQAIATGSVTLRRAGMTVIAVTVAKVFLIDISGLSGLTRVVAFLGLGLSLAGLAWLNRWAAARQTSGKAD